MRSADWCASHYCTWDKEKNAKGIDGRMNNVALGNSKPIFVIKTDESDEMIMRAFDLLNKK